MRAASIFIALLSTGCAPTLRRELQHGNVNELPPAMVWERTLGDPSWWWPYGFWGWELGRRPPLLDPPVVTMTSWRELDLELGREELLQSYRPTRAWRPSRSLR